MSDEEFNTYLLGFTDGYNGYIAQRDDKGYLDGYNEGRYCEAGGAENDA